MSDRPDPRTADEFESEIYDRIDSERTICKGIPLEYRGEDGENHAHHLSTAVDVAFNPRDDDADWESIMVAAVAGAAAFIAAQPCTCDAPDGDVCDRCEVLGRYADRRLNR